MHIGIILLGWLVSAVVLIGGLVASGILTIKIERIDQDDEDDGDSDGEE